MPEGYRSRRTASRSDFMLEKGVRGWAKRRIVCLPCLKRRVRAVELISSFPWRFVSLQTGNADTEKQAYHLGAPFEFSGWWCEV